MKNWLILHAEPGYDAVGGPQVVVSIIEALLDVFTLSGISGLYLVDEKNQKSGNGINDTCTPKPHEDTSDIDLSCPNTSSSLNEFRAPTVWLGFPYETSLGSRTISLQCLTSLPWIFVLEAARGGMNRNLIIIHLVYAFDDVDFASLRPQLFSAKSPKGRPYLFKRWVLVRQLYFWKVRDRRSTHRATIRNMSNVDHYQ